MSYFQLNYFAIVVGAIINMILGMAWYGPIAGKQWLSLIGVTKEKLEEDKNKMGRVYVFTFLGALVTSYVLANAVIYMNASTFYAGVKVGFWLWLGFIAMTGLGKVFFEKRSEELYFIDVGYYLFTLMIVGGILAVWR